MICRIFGVAIVVCLFAARAAAQERRAVVFGTIGGASLGHADSEQGTAPIFGGGLGLHLTRHFLVEGDVHTASVSNVFGRARHDFRQTTFTASLLFRSARDGTVQFIGGGGIGFQRARTDIDEEAFRIDKTETIRLVHGRAGAEWDLTTRLAIRTEGVLWFGEGLDWVVGGRAGISYRF